MLTTMFLMGLLYAAFAFVLFSLGAGAGVMVVVLFRGAGHGAPAPQPALSFASEPLRTRAAEHPRDRLGGTDRCATSVPCEADR